MSQVLITTTLLDDLADSISAKSGEATPMTIAEMTDAVDSIPVPSGTINISQNGSVDVASYATALVAVSGGTPVLQTKSVTYTPSETQQADTITYDSGYDGLDEVDVTVNAISSTYVGSGITRRDDTDLSASGATVTVPSGFYESQATKSVASGSATTPATTITANPSISVSSSGLITATASATKSITPTVASGYVSSGTAGTVTVSGSNTEQLSTNSGSTVTPTTSQQTVDVTGKYMTGNIIVSAMPTGTAGTPTATKGTVSNHAVSVTPSVTNTTGYITGGTKTGTAVSVSASELVSGTLNITSNDTYDVTNYASATVNVSGGGGGGMNWQISNSNGRVNTTSYTTTGVTLTVAEAGTYNVYWTGFRSSTSGTNGSQLHINNSAYGSAQTSFTNSYIQTVKLTGVSLSTGDVLTVYARARGTNYYMCVGNLTIEQTA